MWLAGFVLLLSIFSLFQSAKLHTFCTVGFDRFRVEFDVIQFDIVGFRVKFLKCLFYALLSELASELIWLMVKLILTSVLRFVLSFCVFSRVCGLFQHFDSLVFILASNHFIPILVTQLFTTLAHFKTPQLINWIIIKLILDYLMKVAAQVESNRFIPPFKVKLENELKFMINK